MEKQFNLNEQYIMYRKTKLPGDDAAADAVLSAEIPAEHQEPGKGTKTITAKAVVTEVQSFVQLQL